MEVQIYEQNLEQQDSTPDFYSLMTEDQILRSEYYLSEYLSRRNEIDAIAEEWNELQGMYECRREPKKDPAAPCNFIPLLTPTVEGQVAAMIEADIEYKHITDNPAHRNYMAKLDAASEYIRARNRSHQQFKDFGRYYDNLGNAWMTIEWEDGFGKSKNKPRSFPRLITPPIASVLVDGKIKDYKDLQYAEWIIREIGFMSIGWARKEYGDDYADALATGTNRHDGEEAEHTYSDSNSFMLLHIWTRNNDQGNLQLIEMDTNGLILRESDPSKPYFENVDNEYPFFFARMMPLQGNFYGYGDGKILKPMQECVNSLTDELELACRYQAQSKWVIDPRANFNPNQMNSDPSKPVIMPNPQQYLKIAQAGGVNTVIPTMIEFLLREAQRSTRFSDIMTGQRMAPSATATAVVTQMTQGSVGIRDKTNDIKQVMQDVDRYCLNLCMAKWDKPFWASLADDVVEFVDASRMGQLPTAVPPSSAAIKEAVREGNPIPEFEIPEDENGEIMTNIDFTTRVNIGTAMPKNKNDIYNIILGLMQMQGIDAEGKPVPVLSIRKARQLLEETLGIKLQTADEETEEAVMVTQESLNALNPLSNGEIYQAPTGQTMQNAQFMGGQETLQGTRADIPSADPRLTRTR